MKILVKDLLPNPHRRMKEYPINKEKVEILKNSINETFFWDNLLARGPNGNGKFELAYGHHRLVALQELKIKEIDIPIHEMDDIVMLKVMADENAEEYNMSPAVLNETIKSVKAFLDADIQGKSWKEIMTVKIYRHIFDTAKSLTNAQRKGTGQGVIRAFLGYKNWTEGRVRSALKAIEVDESFDRKAAEEFDIVDHADTFRKEVKRYGIDKKDQKPLAKELKKKKSSSREIAREVRKRAPSIKRPKKDPLFEVLEKQVNLIEDNARRLTNNMAGFNAKADELEVKSVEGIKAMFTIDAIQDLLQQTKIYLKFFGYDYKTVQIGGTRNGRKKN